MPRKIVADQQECLSKEVENVFYRKIATSTNCDHLSREIQIKTSHYISSQTLRRLYGLVKTNTSPSLFTLDALSQYCGYENWDQFCSEKRDIDSPSAQAESFSKWVLDFYKAPLPKLWPSDDYFIACKNIAERIVTDNSLFRKLPSKLATLPSGQILFFECFPYIDGLGNGYQKHLKIYLQNKSNDWQSQIFANCLLFFGSVLTKKESQIKKYYSIINSITCPLPDQLHDIPTARYLGAQILYNKLMGNNDEVLRWLQLVWHQYTPYYKKDEYAFCNYFFVLSEYLFLAGLYIECVELLTYAENPKWKKYFVNYPVDLGYYEVAKVMIAISNLKIGNSSKGKQILEKVNTGAFIFTECKLYTMYFLNEQLNLCGVNSEKKRARITNQIDRLVHDTSFIYFSLSTD